MFVSEGAVLHELSASRATSVPELLIVVGRPEVPWRSCYIE